MKKSINTILTGIAFVIILLGVSCSSSKDASKQLEVRHKQKSSTYKNKDNTLLFIDATKALQLGNIDKALRLFQECVEVNDEDAASYFEIAKIYRMKENIPDAMQAALTATNRDPENVWYKLLLANLYSLSAMYNEYLSVYENIVELKPDNVEYLFNLASAYVVVGRKMDAIRVYDEIESKMGINSEIVMLKKNLYASEGMTDEAIEEIEKLSNAFPDDSKYLAMLAEYYLDNEMEEEALETYKKIAKADPENPYVHISIADYYMQRGDTLNAHQELVIGFLNPDLNIDSKIQILLSYYTVNQLYSKDSLVMELVDVLIKAHPDDARSYSVYADILVQNNENEEAREIIRKALEIDDSDYRLWEQLLFIENDLRDFDAMKLTAEKALNLFPQQPLLYLLAGVANFYLDNFEASIEKLELGLNFVINNRAMMEQFYTSLGDAYNELHNYEKSDDYYERVLDLNPDNSVVLNNYAYYLSLRNEQLERAEKMAKRAIEVDPENSANLDTYGWVLYKLGKYVEAEIYIKKAIDIDDSADGTLLEHYGDVMFKLGNVEEAVKYWEMAEEKGEGSEFLKKKIKDEKLYE